MAIVVTSNESAPAAPVEVEKPAVEAKPETEKPETSEVSEGQESEGLDEDQGNEPEKVAAQESEDKEAKGVKKRIDKLVKQRTDAQREAQYWRDQALRQQKPAAEQAQPKPDSQMAEKPPRQEDFASLAEWLEARDAYREKQLETKFEQKLKERELKSERNQVASNFDKREDAFAKSHEDYHETVETFKEVFQQSPNVALLNQLQTEENGPEIVYEMSKQPEVLSKIMRLPYEQTLMALGEFKAEMKLKAAQSKKVETTNAPTPIKTVGSGTAGPARKTLAEVAKSDSPNAQAEYERMRMEQIKKRQGA